MRIHGQFIVQYDAEMSGSWIQLNKDCLKLMYVTADSVFVSNW